MMDIKNIEIATIEEIEKIKALEPVVREIMKVVNEQGLGHFSFTYGVSKGELVMFSELKDDSFSTLSVFFSKDNDEVALLRRTFKGDKCVKREGSE